MSNILIIKHGSLGDLIQANGAIKDIKEFYTNRKVFLLTSAPYSIFMSECPYIDGVIIDKRLPRWNLFFLHSLKKLLKFKLLLFTFWIRIVLGCWWFFSSKFYALRDGIFFIHHNVLNSKVISFKGV